MLRQCGRSVCSFLIALLTLPLARAAGDEVFERPVRLSAGGEVIDTGEVWGHSGPHLGDVDGDGVRDLIVGSFDGKFRVYHNSGTEENPEFAPFEFLQGGAQVAEVWIYCCIGSSPQLVDLNGDGHLDLISGSYDPGEFYLFSGTGDGRYSARQTLVDRDGNPILRHPDQKQEYQSFGSWISTADWDDDGDLDLVLGSFAGELYVRINEGTRTQPSFATNNILIQIDGENAKVPGGHAALDVADWDADGRWDIISGSDKGGVYWFRNVGTLPQPRFSPPFELIPPHEGNGYTDLLEIGAEPHLGIRTQVDATDYNGDGKLDLLVGDFSGTITPRADLTSQERREFYSLVEQRDEVAGQQRAALDAFREKFFERYPGDLAFSDEADAQWSKDYQAWRGSEEMQRLSEQYGNLSKEIRTYLRKPERNSLIESDDYAMQHGFVWLFLRK